MTHLVMSENGQYGSSEFDGQTTKELGQRSNWFTWKLFEYIFASKTFTVAYFESTHSSFRFDLLKQRMKLSHTTTSTVSSSIVHSRYVLYNHASVLSLHSPHPPTIFIHNDNNSEAYLLPTGNFCTNLHIITVLFWTLPSKLFPANSARLFNTSQTCYNIFPPHNACDDEMKSGTSPPSTEQLCRSCNKNTLAISTKYYCDNLQTYFQ